MKNISLVLLSLLLCCFFLFSPGAFILMVVIFLILSRVNQNNYKNIRFISTLFLSAFIVRVILLLIVNFIALVTNKILQGPYPGWAPNLIGDSSYYTLRGYWMALDWGGFVLPARVLWEAYNLGYGWHGYTYLIAFFHYLFGFSPISSALLNCAIGSLSGILGYLILQQYFFEKVCRVCGILISFFPSLVLWSVFNMKDTSIIFLTLLIIYAFIMFNKTPKLKTKLFFLFLVIIGSLLQNTLRIKIMPLTLASLLISYAVINIKQSFLPKIVFGSFCISILLFTNNAISKHIDISVRRIINKSLETHQAAALQKDSSNYKILENKYYLINKNFLSGIDPDWASYVYQVHNLSYFEYVKVFFKGWIHFMFEPFPWGINTKLKILAFPQMLIWFVLTPFALLGAFIILRYRCRQFFMLFAYFFAITIGCAITMANIGTAFRFRDMVTPVFLMWVSVGLAKFLGWQIMRSSDE